MSRQNYNSKRYMNFRVHSSTIYNSQDMETTQMSINRWMDKEDVVCVCVCTCVYTHIHNEILLNNKKKKILSFAATWKDLEIIILSNKVRKRKTNTIWHHLYVEYKIWHQRTCLQNRNRLPMDIFINRNRLTGIENRFVVAKVRGRDRLWIWG